MAEIKSFREYIAEQEKIKSQVLFEDSDSKAPVSKNLPVANIELKLTAREPKARLDELEEKAEALKRTYLNLDSFITAPDFTLVGPSDKRALVNITNQKSFRKIFEDWYKSYSEKIENLRKTREHTQDVKTLMKPGLIHRKEKLEKARENLSDIYSKNKPNAENEPEDKPINDEVIYERIINPFALASEYASGSRNKYNSNRILTKLVRSKAGKEEDDAGAKGIYGDFDNSKTRLSNKGEFEKMRLSFEKSAYAVIAKRKGYGLPYLDKAIKDIDSYKVKKKYLRNISDEEYLLNISTNLQRAMNTLYTIGSDLQNLMDDYEKALNRISNELKRQDYKNQKFVSGLNAQLAVGKQDKREEKREQKSGEKEEANEIEAGKAAERKAFHDAIVAEVQKDIEAAKNIDQKAAVIFFDILKNASKKDDITPNFLLKKLETDSNRKTKDGAKWTDEDRLASTEAIYALAKFLTDNNLEDFQVGKNSAIANFSTENQTNKLFDVLSPITANIEELVDKTKRLLLTPEGLRKYETQIDAEKNREKLDKESEERTKLKEAAENGVISFIRNNPITYDSIVDRINEDIKNRKKKFSKVDSENLLPEEQEKASAIVSYILLNLLKNREIKKVKEQGLDGAKIAVFNYFSEALEKLKKYEKISDFNKKTKSDAEYNAKLFKSMKSASDSDDSKDDEPKNKDIEFKDDETASAAKDFNGEEPKSIFDYAVQKAKKLQER